MDKQRMNKEREGWNNMSDGEKIKALVDEGGMTEDEAFSFLVDMGEIEDIEEEVKARNY